MNPLLPVILLLATNANISAFSYQQSTLAKRKRNTLNMATTADSDAFSASPKRRGAKVAFVGNSIQYFNDTPRFLSTLSRQTDPSGVNHHNPFIEHQDSCFRGGVSLVGLWEQGNGMLKHGFASKVAVTGTDEHGGNIDVGSSTVKNLLTQKQWDFVVMNDHTQHPARLESRGATIDILVRSYAPLLKANKATPIIIETAAYRLEGIVGSADLGPTEEFQAKVREGILCYLDALRKEIPQSNSPRLAPVGTAYLHVRELKFELWEQLFDSFDNFHPSPKGTFFQGCVLYYTMFTCLPPIPSTTKEIAQLWNDARMMNCADRAKGYEVMPLPTVEEAKYFCEVAKLICEREVINQGAEQNKSCL